MAKMEWQVSPAGRRFKKLPFAEADGNLCINLMSPNHASTKPGRLWQLEALRGFAACYVLLHHVSSGYLKLKYTVWGLPFRFGQEAVLVFFLLSGFVICYSQALAGKEGAGVSDYFIKRSRRIYPIFILALLLAYIVNCLAAHAWVPVDFRQLFGNLFMLQDHPERPGWAVMPFGGNMPLWSLSYEWWFYMMFYPINRWVSARRQKHLVLGLCATGMLVNLFYPNSFCWFLVFFIIWWAGVEMAREFAATGDVTWQRQKSMVLLLGLPLVWYGIISWHWWQQGQPLHFITFPLVEFRFFLLTMVFIGLFFIWKKPAFIGFNQTVGRFYRVGAISYALYLVHYPVICGLRLFGGEKYFYPDLALRIVVVFVLAWLAEGIFQKWINRITAPLLKTRVARPRPVG